MDRCIALILVSCLAFVVVAESHTVPGGGWMSIKDLKQHNLMEIGKFVIRQNNKITKEHLKLIEIVKAQMQFGASIKYRLVLETRSKTKGEKCKNYEALVEEDALYAKRRLLSFTLLGDAKA